MLIDHDHDALMFIGKVWCMDLYRVHMLFEILAVKM